MLAMRMKKEVGMPKKRKYTRVDLLLRTLVRELGQASTHSHLLCCCQL